MRKPGKGLRVFAAGVRRDYPDAKILLFGSRAREEEFEESDYDIIIISDRFAGVNFFARASEIYNYWDSKKALDAFCYTPQEFEKKKGEIGFVSEALRNAVNI